MLALEVNNLYKTYGDGFTALNGLNIQVEQGDFFALLGPNGAGKSTMIGILTSLIRKSSGEVKVLGYDIDSNLYEAQKHIGVVPQEFNFNGFETVEGIIYNQAGFYGLPRHKVKPKLDYYLEKLDLLDKRKTPAGRLSGGMKRRLMIARAMIHEPKLLILDEPTAGVDLEIRRSMWSFIQDINREKGTTIILTTHYLEEAEQLCKNIAIINHGEVIEQTDMKSLLSRLDEETIVLDVDGLAEELIKENGLAIQGYQIAVCDNSTLEVTVPKEKGVSELFIELAKYGIAVKSMRNKSNRLEELFLRLVNNKTH